jgi:hypothetical protein
MGARDGSLKRAASSRAHALHVVDFAMSIEAQLQTLERLIPHLAQHGCDVSAQDGARARLRTSGRDLHPLLPRAHAAN